MFLSFDNKTDFFLDDSIISQIAGAAEITLETEGARADAEISLIIVDNDRIRALNKRYRKIDAATDVLSFPAYCFEPGKYEAIQAGETAVHLGDVAISIEKALSQSEEYGHSLLRELAFLTVHSVLHLLGYDHLTEREAGLMNQKQETILDKANIKRQEKK